MFYGTDEEVDLVMKSSQRVAREMQEKMRKMQELADREKQIQEHIKARAAYEEANKQMVNMFKRIDKEEASSATINTMEEAEALGEKAVLLDADGWVFQRRNGQWFMAGAQFGSEEFSGSFPAKELVVK